MRKYLGAVALLAALATPGAAHAQATITFGATTATPNNNDFKPLLTLAGLTRYATTGASIALAAPSNITFYYLGAESGYDDTLSTISTPNLLFTETANANHFAVPVALGTEFFGAGSLAGRLNFTSNHGAPATVGQDGFGIFLGPNQASGASVSRFILGYDDQITNQDDDHDDLMILAVVEAAVPEPGTWALMLLGFGALGAAMRRKPKTLRVKPALA